MILSHRTSRAVLLVVALAAWQSSAFSHLGMHQRHGRLSAASAMPDVTFEKPDMSDVTEQACIDAARKMERVVVPVSSDVSPNKCVGISYIHFQPSRKQAGSLPLVLVHGFDSSGLEYRRLGPKLAELGIDTYAVDILGWGYTQLSDVTSFSASAKIEALKSFVKTMFGENGTYCIGGASLGGAAAIELAAADSDGCKGLVLIDAQGFVDGIGPMAMMPAPLAKLGVSVLKSVPLRNSANQMSYFDKDTFATEEAQIIGRKHCLREGWSDAMVSFMKSGGFSPSEKIGNIQSPSLVLWGRQDEILDGKLYANKFVETLGGQTTLTYIEECGHVPHLEQPAATSKAIAAFLTSIPSTQSAAPSSPPPYIVGVGFLGALAAPKVVELVGHMSQ